MNAMRLGQSDLETSRLAFGCISIAAAAPDIEYSREDAYRLLEAQNGERVP